MFSVVSSIAFLLSGTCILLIGIGLLFSALGARAALEGFSAATIGLVMSAYFVGFVLGTRYCPTLIRRLGHIRAFALMASVASTTPIFHAIFVSPWIWGVLRALTGICLVGLFMVVESWLNVLAPNRYRGQIMAVYMTTTLVAMAIGQFLMLVGETGDFVRFGLVSILLSLALVPVTMTRVAQPEPAPISAVGLVHLYAVAPVGVIGSVASGMLNGALYSMGAVFAHRVGMSSGQAVLFMSATILGGALLQWPVGRYSDRHDRQTVLIQVCAGTVLLALLAFVFSLSAPNWLLLPAFLYGGLSFTVYGLSVAQVADRVDAREILDATQGLLFLHAIGAVIGPTLAGLLMDRFIPGTLLLYFACVAAIVVAFGYTQRKRNASVADHEPAQFVPMATTSQVALGLDPRLPPPPAGKMGSE